MEEIPLTLLADVSDSERNAVQRWREELTDIARREVAELCDEQREECFFGPPAEGEEQPVVIGGRFLPHDDAWRVEDWEDEWREYLVEHSAQSLGDRWVEGSVLIASQFPTLYRMDGSGIRGRIAEWGRTRFEGEELPPSEQRQSGRTGRCT